MGLKATISALIGDATASGRSMLTAANAAAQKTLLSLVKGDVGLGNVDNTSDANKPVSTAQQTALNLKAALISPALVTPDLGTPSAGTLTNCTFPTLNQNTTGSAATLTTPRTINGVSFNGSANITVTAAGSTLSDTVTVANGGTGLIALGTALQVLRVNAGATALEYAAASGGGIGGSTGGTTNRVLTANGTGGATLQACPVTIDSSGNVTGVNTLTVADAVSATITANTVSGVTTGATGTITNNTTNGLYNSTVKITNDVVASGSVATFNVGLQVGLTTGNSIGIAVVGSQTAGIFIGPSQLVASAPMTCALHSTSTATRQFLFNNSTLGTTGTDGTYFSQATSGEWYLINQETAGRLEFYAGNGISTFILSPTTRAAFINWTTTTLVGLVVKAPASQSANLQEWQNSSGTALSVIRSNGGIGVVSMADSAAANSTLYYSTDAAKLVWKDAGGTVNNLY